MKELGFAQQCYRAHNFLRCNGFTIQDIAGGFLVLLAHSPGA